MLQNKICKNMTAENQQKVVDIISNDVKLISSFQIFK